MYKLSISTTDGRTFKINDKVKVIINEIDDETNENIEYVGHITTIFTSVHHPRNICFTLSCLPYWNSIDITNVVRILRVNDFRGLPVIDERD